MSVAVAAPPFDCDSPFGRYQPRPRDRRWIELCHRVPVIGPWRQVALWLRRPLKYRLATAVDVEVWGLKLRLLPRGNLSESRLLFVPQFYDRVEREALRSFLRPGCVFVNIGANAGAYSFWIYSLFGRQCAIHAVEPDPELTQRIEFNRRTNGAANLRVYQRALSDTRRVALLRRSSENKGQNHLAAAPAAADPIELVAVRVTTLLDLVREARIEKIDALKIDVEGHERHVLDPFFAQAPRELWPRMILCETATSPEQVLLRDSLVDQGYVPGAKTKFNQVLYLPTVAASQPALRLARAA